MKATVHQPQGFEKYAQKTAQEVVQELKTTAKNGLDHAEVQERLERYGHNRLPAKKRPVVWLFLQQWTSPFVYLLVLIALLTAALHDFTNALTISVCILINVMISFYQEYKAEQSLRVLSSYLALKVNVMREGTEKEIPASELVPGDILLLYPGDIIPADIRFLQEDHLQVDESVLSGESMPVTKTVEPVQVVDHDQVTNIGFAGTTIISGKAVAVIIATGMRSSLGLMTQLTDQLQRVSNFSQNMQRFSYFILTIVAITTAVIFIAHLLINYNTLNVVNLALFAIALAITIIPEALPVVTTFSFTRGALRLARHNVVVKRLSAIEDLGGIELLCMDKTGTITHNELAVAATYGAQEEVLRLAALGSGLSARHTSIAKGFDAALWQKLSDEQKEELQTYEKIFEIPFDPVRRRNMVYYQRGNEHLLIVRGAPDDLLARCILVAPAARQEITAWIEREGNTGHRVMAIAMKKLEKSEQNTISLAEQEHELHLIGLISFADPLKHGAITAIKKAMKLGVSIKILSGDSTEACAYVAQKIGLIKNSASVMTGEQFSKLSSDQKNIAVENVAAFARVNPTQKYEIIQLLQEKYHVGYIGDGINDAPALKIAHVALTVTDATDVAREASDIILLNPSLNVIINGIEEGRIIFANMIKYLRITLAAGFGHFYALAIASLLIDFPPMLPVQLLVLNLLTDLPLIALSADTISLEEVSQPQRYHLGQVFFSATVLGLVITTFDFILFVTFWHAAPRVLQTNWFIACILTEILFVFSARTQLFLFKAERPAKFLLLLSMAIAALTIILPYTSFGQRWLYFSPPSLHDWMIIAAIVIACIITAECVKLLYYHLFSARAIRKV